MTYIGPVRCREVSSWGECELGPKNDVQFRERCPL